MIDLEIRWPSILAACSLLALTAAPPAAASSTIVCAGGVPVTCAYPTLQALGHSCTYEVGAWTCAVAWRVDMEGSGVTPCIYFTTNVGLTTARCGATLVTYGQQTSTPYANPGPGFKTVTASGTFCVSMNHALEQCADLSQDYQIPPPGVDPTGSNELEKKIRPGIGVLPPDGLP